MNETRNRYKVILEYIGTDFCGWQKQKDAISVQSAIEDAIFKFSGEQVPIFSAGRTDSGVHAYGQVAHFDLTHKHPAKKLMLAINHFVKPHRVGIIECEEVDPSFHARFWAVKRHYLYKIINRPAENIISQGLQYWIRDPLDIEAMNSAAAYLIGKHDFSSFRSSECQASSPIRTLDRIWIERHGDNIDIYVSALSFLHHMVRNIVGSLVMVGRGLWDPEQIKLILEAKDRNHAGPMAPAEGLYFLKVDY